MNGCFSVRYIGRFHFVEKMENNLAYSSMTEMITWGGRPYSLQPLRLYTHMLGTILVRTITNPSG